MTKRVAVALRLQKDKGVVQAEQGPGQYVLWKLDRAEIVKQPQAVIA
jgi:hypothetical protein